MNGKYEKCPQNLSRKREERDHFGDPDVDGLLQAEDNFRW